MASYVNVDWCRRCGKIGHHKQECPETLSAGHEFVVSRLFKRIQMQENVPHLIGSYGVPVSILKHCMDFASNFYVEKRQDVEDLGLPGIDLSTCAEFFEKHHQLNLEIVMFRKTDHSLTADSKRKSKWDFASEDEFAIFRGNMDSFSELRQEVYTLSNKYTMWALNARQSLTPFRSSLAQLQLWFPSISKDLGRPTAEMLPKFKEEFDKYAGILRGMKREAQNLLNICHKLAVMELRKAIRLADLQFANLKVKWHEVEVRVMCGKAAEDYDQNQRKLVEELTDKLTCGLCFADEKSWSLLCGHLYCKKCVDNLEIQRAAEGLIDDWGIQNSDVAIPSAECAYCRGSTTGKHRIYF